MQQFLTEHWTEYRDELLSELSEGKKGYTAKVLENQRRHLLETADAGVVASGNVAQFQKVVLPMIRRIIPSTIGTELVGIQPMTGPVGLAYSLRVLYAQDLDTPPIGTASANDITGWNGSNGGEAEVFGVADKYRVLGIKDRLRRFYSAGSGATSTGLGSPVADMEAFGGRQLTLEVLKQPISTGTRKLQARWTIESMQDLKATHGLDVETEITNALSNTIISEIDNEIITDLYGLAGTARTVNLNAVTGTPHFVGDKYAAIGVTINAVANEIARKTRRGPANWIVVSPQMASVLQSATKSVFAPAISGSFEGPNNTKLIGTLNNSIKVYTYIYHDYANDAILVGYKGGNGETDVGYFYHPYIPLMKAGQGQDPATTNMYVSLMTRYGKSTFTESESSLGNSADYYGRIEVTNLVFA